MANAFTIRIFAPDGDPEGVRVIDRWEKHGLLPIRGHMPNCARGSVPFFMMGGD
jgi:hypothetical protein